MLGMDYHRNEYMAVVSSQCPPNVDMNDTDT